MTLLQVLTEGKAIVSSLSSLKYELQHNRALSPIPDDGSPDVKLYNDELEARGPPTWHNVEWLFSECYLYRRMATFFSMAKTSFWKRYDPFYRQKMKTFKSSRPAVLELCARYKDIITQIRSSRANAPVAENVTDEKEIEKAEKLLFVEMAEICLWGNATDLSLLTSLSYEDIQKLQGSNARKDAEKNILVNDFDRAFSVLTAAQKAKKERRRVDIVLDNAGFELFVDLLLAGYMLATGLATEVVLHPKDIPWFVSDVVPKDFQALLSAMQDPKSFYQNPSDDEDDDGTTPAPLSDEEVANVQFLFDDWTNLHSEGQLILRPNRFWTHAGSFWRMPHVAAELVEDLKDSELVVFKGDLNYRKLAGDVCSPSSLFPLATLYSPCQVRVGVFTDLGKIRLHGPLQRLSPKPSIPSARPQASESSLYAHAKLTSWWDCQRARTKRYEQRRVEAVILVPGNGHGVGSGLLCSSLMGRPERMSS